MQGFIEEPLLLVKDQDESLACLSNVCTHRANIIIHNTGKVKDLNVYIMEENLTWMVTLNRCQNLIKL